MPMHEIKCIVVSTNGFDASTVMVRAQVASILWSGNIVAEYLPQSSALTGLKSHLNDELASDWSLEQIFQVSFLLRIPFVVIVATHFLRHKKSVRVKQTYHHALGFKALGGHEEVVKLEHLPSFINERIDAIQKIMKQSIKPF